LTAAQLGVAAVPGGVATAAGTAATAAASSGGLFSAGNLMLASGLASAGGALMGGMEQASAAKVQAAQADLMAQAEKTKASEREEARQRELNRALASQTVAWGARGISTAVGSPQTVAGAMAGSVGRESRADTVASGINAASYTGRASSLRSSVGSSLVGGVIKAGGSLLDAASRLRSWGR
jgi:stage V sporulation protein SpoVS